MQFYKLSIHQILKETKNAISITFSVPENLKAMFQFKAGQYLTLKGIIKGEEIRRDYSLCSSPKSGLLKVVVKEVDSGKFSTYANNKLKAGDILEVAPPRGRFTFEPDFEKQRHLLLFAAGSGITPVMSIVKTVLQEEPRSVLTFVYGNKTVDDTIFFNDLNTLQDKYRDRFEIQYVFSQSNEDNALFGRIDRSVVNFVLNSKLKHDAIDAIYLCGPEEMIHTVSDTLKDNGINDDLIKYELFTPSLKESPSETDLEDKGITTVTVMVDDEESSFTMPQSKTILEAALENKIDAPYSCQGGICSSCIARITEGEATMRQNNILTDSELAEGLILTCQAQPTTSKISIDYDDV